MTQRIALVVPALAMSAGVGSVAEFIRKAIRGRGDFELKLISLAMSSKDEFSVQLLRPSTWRKGVRTGFGTFNGEPFVHVGAQFVEIELQRLKPREALSRLVRDCDLIQVVAGTPCWALPVCGLGIPVILQVATLAHVERRQRSLQEIGLLAHWRRLMTHAVSRFDERALTKVDAILVENQWMLDHVLEANCHGNALVRFAPPGVNTVQFAPAAKRDPQAGYILCVGRLSDPRKNTNLLIEAYLRLNEMMDNPPRLLLAGRTSPDSAFWERAQRANVARNIELRLNPTVQELALLYRNAQSFVSTSDEEGFGVALVEAMASGLPVVATRSGGPEGIIADGDDGYLVDRGDSCAVAEKLQRLALDLDLNIRMGNRARQKVLTKFDEGVAAATYLAVYDELLSAFTARKKAHMDQMQI